MESGKNWMSISDMMSGLMMVFLFISVLYIAESLKDVEEIDKAYKDYLNDKEKIYQALNSEFHSELKQWNAELIKEELTIKFLSPDIIFNAGESSIKNPFKVILNSFCPRYFNILHKFQSISEIRIEGHTSDEWKGADKQKAYFKNMELSQDRTRSVLEYCVNVEGQQVQIKGWAQEHLTANGLSSSKPICTDDNVVCRGRNRRVEFRVQIGFQKVIDTIKQQKVANKTAIRKPVSIPE